MKLGEACKASPNYLVTLRTQELTFMDGGIKIKFGDTGMSGERGEKSGRWVVVIVFLIWAISLAGFSFSPSDLHIPSSLQSGEFSLNLFLARENLLTAVSPSTILRMWRGSDTGLTVHRGVCWLREGMCMLVMVEGYGYLM